MMILKRYLIFTLSVALSFGGQLAQASILDLDAIKPLAELELLPKDQFRSQTDLITKTPYNDELLSYEVRLPKEWKETEARPSLPDLSKANESELQQGLSENVFGMISNYVSPPKDYRRSRFYVEALNIPHEIGARNWFIYYVMQNSFAIEQIGLEEEGQVEVLYIEVEGDQSYVVRAKIIINGSRMILAKYALPVELYNDEKVQQAQVIDSFELVNRSNQTIEENEIHAFLDQSFVNYPRSWVVNAPRIRSINRMNAMFLNYDQTEDLVGQINVYLTNKSLGTSRADEMKFYREKFDIPNFKHGKLISSPKLNFHDDMTFGVTQVYELKSQLTNLVDYELWLSIIENEDYYYFVSLLTPSRDEDFYNWARNTQTYKLSVKSLRRFDSTVEYYDFL